MDSLALGEPPVQSPPAFVPEEADAGWWEDQTRDATPGEPPTLPLLPFADWVAVQASYYRSLGTAAAGFLAGEIDGLADMARALDAMCGEALRDRRAQMSQPEAWDEDEARARSERALARLEDEALAP